MKTTKYEAYELYVEVKKDGSVLTAEAAEFIRDQGKGRIDDFGHYWRVHGWICYEVDITTEDGEITDWESIGSTAVSDF